MCWNVDSLRTEPARVYLAHDKRGLVGHLIIINPHPPPAFPSHALTLILSKDGTVPQRGGREPVPPLCVLPKPIAIHLPPHGVKRNGLPSC